MYIFRTFTHNMLAFGLSKKLCNDFLKKQAVIGNLNEGKSLKEQFGFDSRPESSVWGLFVMFSLCPHGFPLGIPASSRCPKTCIWAQVNLCGGLGLGLCTLPLPSVSWDRRCEQTELKKMIIKKSVHPGAGLTQLLYPSKFLHGNTYHVIHIATVNQICFCGLLICRAIQVAN